MAKPRSKPQLSLDSAHVYDDAGGIPEDHWCRLFFEHIYCAFDESEFADMYEEGGRYPISPVLLSCVTILQYMFQVSDRAAVEDSVMRRDWRIALGVGRDYEGFDASVLTRFRQRLVAHNGSEMILQRVLCRVQELGFLRGRRRLRVDATHVVANVARLSRSDALQEAMRVVVCSLYDRHAQLRCDPELMRLYDAYGEENWLGGSDSSDERLRVLGRDGYALLALCGTREARGKETLAAMLEQNFVRSEGGEMEPRGPDDAPSDRIATPHEPDVRWGKKGDKTWLGDKAHLVETAEEDGPNFVVDVMTTDPRVDDSTVAPEIAERARFAAPDAETLIADGGYASARNTKEAMGAGIDLVAPPRGNSRRGHILLSEFELDFQRQVARCPEGCQSVVWRTNGRGIYIRFRASDCAGCRRRSECTSSAQGRTLGPSREYEQLLRDRRRAETEEFRELYRCRAPIEATISELVHCYGLRRSRYRGAAFRELHAVMSVTALNVRRLLRCVAAQDAPESAPILGPLLASRVHLFGFLRALRAILSRMSAQWRCQSQTAATAA